MATESDFVRIEDPVTRMHVTVSRATAESAGAPILDRPATDAYGMPLAAKSRTAKDGETEPAEKRRAANRKDASDG